MAINLETFRNNLTYEVTAPVAKILEELNEIDAIHETAKIKGKRFSTMLFWFICAGIFFIALSKLIDILWILIGIGFFIASLYMGAMRSRYKRLNVPKERYDLLKQVLPMLERDIEKGADVSVRLVLSPSTQKQKVTQTVPHPRYSGFKIDYYKDEWLKLQGKFIDKTYFLLTIAELNQTKYGSKRSISGKSKYKSKTKSQGLDIGLTLIYPRKRYGAVKILQNQVREAIKLPSVAAIKGIKVTNKNIKLIVNVPKNIDNQQEELYKTITLMFLSLYQVLNLARMLSKK